MASISIQSWNNDSAKNKGLVSSELQSARPENSEANKRTVGCAAISMAEKLRGHSPLANKLFAFVGTATVLWYPKRVKRFFAPNIDRKGRLARALYGCAMIVAGWLLNRANQPGLGVAAIVAGGFACLEAARGWCIIRASGIKTKW